MNVPPDEQTKAFTSPSAGDDTVDEGYIAEDEARAAVAEAKSGIIVDAGQETNEEDPKILAAELAAVRTELRSAHQALATVQSENAALRRRVSELQDAIVVYQSEAMIERLVHDRLRGRMAERNEPPETETALSLASALSDMLIREGCVSSVREQNIVRRTEADDKNADDEEESAEGHASLDSIVPDSLKMMRRAKATEISSGEEGKKNRRGKENPLAHPPREVEIRKTNSSSGESRNSSSNLSP